MTGRPEPGSAGAAQTQRRLRALTLTVVAAAVAYAGWASGARPFTTTADVTVSIPSALLAAGFVAGWLVPADAHWRRPAGSPPGRVEDHTASVAPWLALVAVVAATELASYFHGGPRSLYPTISSAVEELFRHRPVKAAAFLGWLAGGWYVLTR